MNRDSRELPKGARAIKRGWLLVRKGHWKKRWVVMEANGYLKWYNMKGSPKGVLKLKNSSYTCEHRVKSHHEFCFEISHRQWFRKMKFRANSQNEFNSWLRLIQRAITDADSMVPGNHKGSPSATHKLRNFASSSDEDGSESGREQIRQQYDDMTQKQIHSKDGNNTRVDSNAGQEVSAVLGVTHHTHIEYDPVTGTLVGLPDEWSGLASVEQRGHKEAAISLEDNARHSLKSSQIFGDFLGTQAGLKFEEAACERYFARDLKAAESDYKMAAAIHFARDNFREAARTMSICARMWKEEARKKKTSTNFSAKDLESSSYNSTCLANEYKELAYVFSLSHTHTHTPLPTQCSHFFFPIITRRYIYIGTPLDHWIILTRTKACIKLRKKRKKKCNNIHQNVE